MFDRVFPTRRQADTPTVRLSGRLQQAVAQHAATLQPRISVRGQQQTPTPRRIPSGAGWAALAGVILLLSIVAGLWRLADPPRSAPPNVTPAIINPSIGAAPVAPVEAGSRPQEDAPVVLAALPLAEYRLPAPHLSAGPAAPTPAPHEPRVSPRGGPLPSAVPGVTIRPAFGAWWANRRYE